MTGSVRTPFRPSFSAWIWCVFSGDIVLLDWQSLSQACSEGVKVSLTLLKRSAHPGSPHFFLLCPVDFTQAQFKLTTMHPSQVSPGHKWRRLHPPSKPGAMAPGTGVPSWFGWWWFETKGFRRTMFYFLVVLHPGVVFSTPWLNSFLEFSSGGRDEALARNPEELCTFFSGSKKSAAVILSSFDTTKSKWRFEMAFLEAEVINYSAPWFFPIAKPVPLCLTLQWGKVKVKTKMKHLNLGCWGKLR